jgi:hypothetical protein
MFSGFSFESSRTMIGGPPIFVMIFDGHRVNSLLNGLFLVAKATCGALAAE